MYEIISIEEVENTQENAGASSFLQSVFWASFKELSGWNRKFFLVSCKNTSSQACTVFYLSVLLRRIRFFGCLAYIPMLEDVVVCDRTTDAGEMRRIFLLKLIHKLFAILPRDVFIIRIDPSWQVEVDNTDGRACHTDKVEKPLINFGNEKDIQKKKKEAGNAHSNDVYTNNFCVDQFKIVKARTDIQPPDTVILPLEKTEDQIMGQFKSKWRYNIRLAEKKGCIVDCMPVFSEQEIEDSVNIFYSLYETTSKRDGIAIHTKNYYKMLFLLARKYPDISVRLYVAKYEGSPLAAIITIFYRNEATYLYGASSNEHRNIMPTYLLQYRAIIDAKAFGCKTYDFYGMPPREDEKHPMAGLYRFKTGFGGKIVHRIGSIDAYRNEWLYGAYSLAEEMRSFYFKHIKKWFKK